MGASNTFIFRADVDTFQSIVQCKTCSALTRWFRDFTVLMEIATQTVL